MTITARPTLGGTFALVGKSTARIGYGMGQITRKAENGVAWVPCFPLGTGCAPPRS
jgi:hypothetical protein